MDSPLVQNGKIIQVFAPASRSSAATGDYINMRYYDRVEFIIQTGSVTAGGNVIFKEAKDVSGTSAATLNFDYFWEMTAASDTYTKTSADSSTSADCVTIGNSDDSKIFVVSIKGDILSDSFDCVTCTVPAGFSAANTAVTAIAYRSRYAQAAPPTALT